ncbi:ecdysone 20-monooxygenase-like [Teleopsis dalmanni]|uniref:ecdysone 20-monooxygenase-like n=1 Tax=Teleopsis dalmanni TaxID=139649 RepID=UPI0018CE2CBA|nr:ecdysone 20-monooxygenase-like [Teleopsis dalmanni]
MVMVEVVLILAALLLGFYCNVNRHFILSKCLKPLLERQEFIKFNTTQNGYQQPNANDARPKDTIWDIPGPATNTSFGFKWLRNLFTRDFKMSKLHEVYTELNLQYGDIVREVKGGGIPVVHLFNKNDLEKVLKYPSKYPFRPPTEIVVTYRRSRPDRYASIGIVNEQGPTWHKLRSSLTSSITSPRIIQHFLPALNSICDDFIDLLRKERDPLTNEVRNFEDIANLMGLEAVCMFILGRRMGFLTTKSKQPKKIQTLAVAVKQLFIAQRDSYYSSGWWKLLPGMVYRKFARSEEIIYDVVSEMVDKALEEDSNTLMHDDNDTALRSVFLNILEVKDLDIRDKKSALIDFIAAGIETLANTLIFILNSVTTASNAAERIIEEFREYRNTNITQEALTNASFTKACLQESYRIRPTAFCLARILEEDMQLSGYNIKAGTVVLCQTMTACLKESNFQEAHKYRPERWLDPAGNFSVNNQSSSTIVVPFGIGKRTCPGKRFVEMEIVLLVAKLLLAFDISFKKPLEMEFEFLLAPKTPLNLVLRDRTF